MNNTEIFKDIPGYEGFYQVSNLGNVKSLAREILRKGKYPFISKERILKHSIRSGYYQVKLWKEGKTKAMTIHILVAMAFLGHIPDGTNRIVPDHKNDITTDNRLENLQLLTNRQNIEKYFLRKKTSSKYTGVCWFKKTNKWQAYIKIDGKTKHLGYFTDEYEAHLAYQKALKELL
jgi:hypothetical protein